MKPKKVLYHLFINNAVWFLIGCLFFEIDGYAAETKRTAESNSHLTSIVPAGQPVRLFAVASSGPLGIIDQYEFDTSQRAIAFEQFVQISLLIAISLGILAAVVMVLIARGRFKAFC